MSDHTVPPPPGGDAAAPAARRRWPRRVAAALAVVFVLLGAAVWLLGRETTLQQIVARVASASGGQIAVTGVSGSLYGRMHVKRLVFRSPDSVLTADDITVDWSPLQFFSEGVAISELHIAAVSTQATGPGEPATMPTSLAPPFRLRVASARLDRLTLLPAKGESGAPTVISAIALRLDGDSEGWRLRDAGALTPVGKVQANATIGAQRPFALDGAASLTQTAGIAPGTAPAQLALTARGSLAQLDIAAKGTSTNATGTALLTLAPFDPIMLRAVDIAGAGIDPARFNPAWPSADVRMRLQAKIGDAQQLSGSIAVHNEGTPGPLDAQRLPLRAITGQLGGTLSVATLDQVVIDLGAAGSFRGGGRLQRAAPDAGIDAASFQLRTERLDLHGIQGSIKPTRIAGDIAIGSTGATQTLTVKLAQAGLTLDAQATLADQLVRIKQARLLAGKGSVNVSGTASLAGDQAFAFGAAIARFDPSVLGAFPVADLNAEIKADGKLVPAWQADATFKVLPSRLSGQPLSGSGALRADGLSGAPHLASVDAKLALGQNSASVRGAFGAAGEQLQWQLDGKQLTAVSAGLLGALDARGTVTGTFEAPRTSFKAEARGLGLAAAKRPVPDSVLRVAGDAWLAGPARNAEIKASGSAQRFNPAAFGDYPAGSINGDFSASGKLADDWRAALDVTLQPSTLAGAPLTGHARATADHRHIDNADIDVRLGANSMQAKGGFGGARDRLDWKLDAPELNRLGAGFAGTLRGSGVLTGSIERPALTFQLDGAKLRAFGQHQLDSVRASATLGGGDNNAPLVTDIDLTGYSSGDLAIERIRLKTTGTRAAHTAELSGANADFDALLKLRGGWNGSAWSGAIEALQNKGRYALALQAPAPLRLAGPAGSGAAGLARPDQIALGTAIVKLPEGSIRIESLDKTGARWRSKGQAAGVPVSYLAQLSDLWRDNIVSDLTLGADWALDMQAAPLQAAPAQASVKTNAKGSARTAAVAPAAALDGTFHVFREKGDVTVTSGDKPITLGLRKLDARASVAGNALRMQVELDGARAGQARLDATTQLVDGRVAGNSALTMTGNVNIDNLAWLAPLTGVAGLELGGAFKAAIAGSGTIAAPVLNGDLQGDRLIVNLASEGIKLRNGQLRAALAGDRLQLQRLSFDGQQGNAHAEGWFRFANAEATMELKLVADKLQVLARPDRSLVLSGQSTLVRDQKHFQLDGKFKADRARIELASENTPTISSDVVVLGRTPPVSRVAQAQALPLNVDVEADLGDAFYLRGMGLDSQLAGAVRVRIQDRRAPRVNGSIRVVNGTYAAYGQKLAIERGVLNFTGAYDNPGLNILAVRKRPEGEALSDTNVEAGVEVRGTALSPQAKLVSTPSVPDSDKLSWLVLGHSMADTAGNEMGLLGTAAGALFGGAGGSGGGIAGKLGLDELGVSQAKGMESTVVTVGKRISSRAYLSFEQGATTASSLVKIRYKLNPRITLQFQTGTNTALDVLYSWAFD